MPKWFGKVKRLFNGHVSSATQSEYDNEDSRVFPPAFSLEELRRATGDFCISRELAQVHWGIIYKGILADGCTVTVKRMSKRRDFENERRILSHLRHQNIIEVLGHCVEGECFLLVYEFMENASLGHILFDQDQRWKLNWETRLRICKGVAKGLNYLHHESGNLIIVHRNVKPWNVLLDKDFNPKLIDFSLSRLVDQEENDGSISLSTNAVGTLGYMAPEYLSGGLLSSKLDVYSFGILVIEIASGKPIKDFDFHAETKIRELKRKGNLVDILDPSLGKNYSVKEAQRLLDLSIICTESDPNKRPDMSLVIRILEGKETRMDPSFYELYVDGGDSLTSRCSFVYPFRTEEEEPKILNNVGPSSGNLDKLLDDLTNMSVGPSEVDDSSFEELKAVVLSMDFRETLFLETHLKLLHLCEGLQSNDLPMEEMSILDQIKSFLDGIPELSSAEKMQDDQSLYLAKYESVKLKVESTKTEATNLQSRASALRASIANISERSEVILSEITKLQDELDGLSKRKIDEENELGEIAKTVTSRIREVPPLARWLTAEFNQREEAENKLNHAIKCLDKGEAEWDSIQKRF